MKHLSSTNPAFSLDQQALPSIRAAWTDAERKQRIGKPIVTTYGAIGVTDLPAHASCIAYLDVDDHPHLDTPDDRHTFDCVDLDRLFAYTTYREWNRHDQDSRYGILLTGPSGTGKTTYLAQRFAQLGIPLYSDTARFDMMALDLIQTKEVVNGTTYWEDGPMLKAIREGCPFVLQEINNFNPSQLLALNEIIEKGRVLLPENGERFIAQRGFHVFGTCNGSFTEDRTGAFKGVRGQNQAVSNRFYAFDFPFASVDKEVACLRKIHPEIDEPLARCMATFAEFTRKAADPLAKGGYEGKRLSRPVSRRHLLAWAEMIKGMVKSLRDNNIDPAPYTLKPIYTANLAPEELPAVNHFLELAFSAEPVSP